MEKLFNEYDNLSKKLEYDDISPDEFNSIVARLKEIEDEVKRQGGKILDAGWYNNYIPPTK